MIQLVIIVIIGRCFLECTQIVCKLSFHVFAWFLHFGPQQETGRLVAGLAAGLAASELLLDKWLSMLNVVVHIANN